MKTNKIDTPFGEIVEILSDETLIKTPQDALDLMVDVGSQFMILHEHNLEEDFFDLSTRKAGEILLKFSNYRVSLAVVGDFQKRESKAFQAFMYESNRQGEYVFVTSTDEAVRIWTRKAA
jgi:hypothetical protein